jgi:flagellar basal body-associated protein FliL
VVIVVMLFVMLVVVIVVMIVVVVGVMPWLHVNSPITMPETARHQR